MSGERPAWDRSRTSRRLRHGYRVAGCACVGLATLGAVVPLLPTTPLLLFAAWLFSKSSPTLRARLYGHPRFGPLLTSWREERAIPRKAKAVAIAALLASWSGITLSAGAPAVPALAAAVMVPVGIFIATRPPPRPVRERCYAIRNKSSI